MKDNDKIQVTLTRTQAATLRNLLLDANVENIRQGNMEADESKPWKMVYADVFYKRAHTARVVATKLGKVSKDKRRKYLDLSVELFPVAR